MGLMDDVDNIVWDLALANADQFPGVESFTYHRRGSGALTVNGPVFRDPPEFDPGRMANVQRVRVFVSKAQVPSVDCPGDVVELAETLGGPVEKHAVKEILNQDAGGWELLL